MKLSELYQLTEMPKMVIEELNEAKEKIPQELLQEYSVQLTELDLYERAEAELVKKISPDKNGFKMLFVMMNSALIAYEKYEQNQISKKIFIDTMKGFSRIVKENYAISGYYFFDRSWWMGRYLSLQLFRIGELEYEMLTDGEEKKISIHIPSDSNLSKANASIKESRRFFHKYFSDCQNAEYICVSWLMSPALDILLDGNSKIRNFKANFKITDVYPDDENYKRWVFKNTNLNPVDFPEDTTLQRKIKAYVLSGNKIGEAKGIYIMTD